MSRTHDTTDDEDVTGSSGTEASATGAAPTALLQRLQAGGPATPGDVMGLQRTLGNRSTTQLVPVVQRNSPQPTAPPTLDQRLTDITSKTYGSAVHQQPNKERLEGVLKGKALMTPANFKAATHTRGHQRGAAIKAIDEYLPQYESIKAGAGEKQLRDREQLLLKIKFAAQNWMLDHVLLDDDSAFVRKQGATASDKAIIDPKRKKRYAGVEALLGEVVTELGVVRDALKDLDGNLTATEDITATTAGDRHSKLKTKYEGGASSTFAKLGFLIDTAVPKAGDSTEIEIAFRWPVSPEGAAFVGGTLRASASNGSVAGDGNVGTAKKNVTARVELAFTFGAQFAEVAKLQAEIGGYLESSAGTGAEVMTLVSYGLYRKAVESFVFPQSFIDRLWGGRSGEFGRGKAEAWSKKVEKDLLGAGSENYVEMGMLAGASFAAGKKFGNGVGLEAEGGITFNRGTRYDAAGQESKGGAGNKNERHKKANLSAAQMRLGRRAVSLGFEFGATVGPFSGGAGFSMKWLSEQAIGHGTTFGLESGNKMKLAAAELELAVGGSVPNVGGDAFGEQIAGWIGEGAKTITEKVRAYFEQKDNELKGGDAAKLGVGEGLKTVVDGLDQLQNISSVAKAVNPVDSPAGNFLNNGVTATNLSDIGSQHAANMAETFGEGGKASFSKALENRSLDSSIGLQLSFGIDFVEGNVAITISMEKEKEFAIPMFLDVSVSRSSRIVSFVRPGWGAKWEVR